MTSSAMAVYYAVQLANEVSHMIEVAQDGGAGGLSKVGQIGYGCANCAFNACGAMNFSNKTLGRKNSPLVERGTQLQAYAKMGQSAVRVPNAAGNLSKAIKDFDASGMMMAAKEIMEVAGQAATYVQVCDSFVAGDDEDDSCHQPDHLGEIQDMLQDFVHTALGKKLPKRPTVKERRERLKPKKAPSPPPKESTHGRSIATLDGDFEPSKAKRPRLSKVDVTDNIPELRDGSQVDKNGPRLQVQGTVEAPGDSRNGRKSRQSRARKSRRSERSPASKARSGRSKKSRRSLRRRSAHSKLLKQHNRPKADLAKPLEQHGRPKVDLAKPLEQHGRPKVDLAKSSGRLGPPGASRSGRARRSMRSGSPRTGFSEKADRTDKSRPMSDVLSNEDLADLLVKTVSELKPGDQIVVCEASKDNLPGAETRAAEESPNAAFPTLKDFFYQSGLQFARRSPNIKLRLFTDCLQPKKPIAMLIINARDVTDLPARMRIKTKSSITNIIVLLDTTSIVRVLMI